MIIGMWQMVPTIKIIFPSLALSLTTKHTYCQYTGAISSHCLLSQSSKCTKKNKQRKKYRRKFLIYLQDALEILRQTLKKSLTRSRRSRIITSYAINSEKKKPFSMQFAENCADSNCIIRNSEDLCEL